MTPPLVGDFEIVVTMVFTSSPGAKPDVVGNQVANSINLPLGLYRYLKKFDVNVVDSEHKPKLV